MQYQNNIAVSNEGNPVEAKGPKRQLLKWEDFDANAKDTPADQLKLKTACFCCICGVKECEMAVEAETHLLCTATRIGLACGCGEEFAACNQQALACYCCDNMDKEKGMKVLLCGNIGVFLCCISGATACQTETIQTCCSIQGQICCADLRVALPCTEAVPQELGCCGQMCKVNVEMEN